MDVDGTLIQFDKMRTAIATASTVDEVKGIVDKTEVFRIVAKKAGASLEVVNQVVELKIWAERRAGEMLRDMEKHRGGRPQKNQSHDDTGYAVLSDLNITKSQSARWQQIAGIPNRGVQTSQTKEHSVLACDEH